MCLLVIAYKVHPKYKLILAANRDEYYSRPSEHLNFWKDSPFILAGKDLKCNGTWLGITRNGRFSAITNYRDPAAIKEGRPSRGLLVRRFLETDVSPEDYLIEVKKQASEYNPFNLIVGNRNEIWYYSNKADIKRLSPGIYGLSNHLLDTPWPKVRKSKERLKQIIADQEIDIEAIFTLLKDKNIPASKYKDEKEQLLSSIFIRSPDYGTRASYVILMEENLIHFFEQNYIPPFLRERRIEFHIMLN